MADQFAQIELLPDVDHEACQVIIRQLFIQRGRQQVSSVPVGGDEATHQTVSGFRGHDCLGYLDQVKGLEKSYRLLGLFLPACDTHSFGRRRCLSDPHGPVTSAGRDMGRSENLTLWAESPEEARLFLARAKRQGLAEITEIYVAKRSPKNRSNDYIEGEYFSTSNDEHVLVFDEIVIASPKIVALVQWCTCDVMLSWGSEPICVLEDTTHIVRMNVYQRFPRVLRAAMEGVPALALQGTRGLDFSKRGDCWGLHRYMRAYAAASLAFPDIGVLPFIYLPGDDELRAEAEALAYMNALINGDEETAARLRALKIAEVVDVSDNGYLGHVARDIQSIDVSDTEVTVRIGAQPDKKSWREKGSGQMDPYIGMIAAAKYVYCFDSKGRQTKPLVVSFKFLPPDFFWFKGWESSRSLYKTLAFKIGDRVEFLG